VDNDTAVTDPVLYPSYANGEKLGADITEANLPSLTDICTSDTDICMKTTLNFDDRLIRDAKKRAADEGETLTRLVEKALREYLRARRRKRTGFKLDPLTKRGIAATGINWDDRNSLYERMEGRD
jgi:hypothetical protein